MVRLRITAQLTICSFGQVRVGNAVGIPAKIRHPERRFDEHRGSRSGAMFRRRSAVSSHLRVATSTSLIAFGMIIGIDVLAFLVPTADRSFILTTKVSNPTEIDCDQQTWWHFDRDCLLRRGRPWVAEHERPNAGTIDEVNYVPEQQPLTETLPAAMMGTASSIKKTDVTAPKHEVPAQLSGTKVKTGPHIQKKKVARRAKRPTNEALNAIRKFGDNLDDTPMTAYAADGTQRRVVRRSKSGP
jgi:hypothetical protein